jgi:hypothetical protein
MCVASKVGFLVPASRKGTPMPRLQAALGIASPVDAELEKIQMYEKQQSRPRRRETFHGRLMSAIMTAMEITL